MKRLTPSRRSRKLAALKQQAPPAHIVDLHQVVRLLSIPVTLFCLVSFADFALPGAHEDVRIIEKEQRSSYRYRGGRRTVYEVRVTDGFEENTLTVSKDFFRRVRAGERLRMERSPLFGHIKHVSRVRFGRNKEGSWFDFLLLHLASAFFLIGSLMSWKIAARDAEATFWWIMLALQLAALLYYPLRLAHHLAR